ncbi:MAG: cadherin-like domain-containing protein [Pseudomonadota bacterium]
MVDKVPGLAPLLEPSINATVNDGSDAHLGKVPVQVAPKPSNHYSAGSVYLSRDGSSATLANGDVINAGPGGQLALDANGNLVVTRPASGFDAEDDAVFDVTRYNTKGQLLARSEVQVISDPEHPGDPTYNIRVTQGQTRDITLTHEDGSTTDVKAVFQVGLGWVDTGTSEVVQDIKTWQKTFAVGKDDPTNPASANAVNGADLQSDLYKAPVANGNRGTDLTPVSTSATRDTASSTMTVGYSTVKIGGVEYHIQPSGVLMRSLGGGVTEWRDPDTFEGVITNVSDRGDIVPAARLAPGDVVRNEYEDGAVRIDADPSVTKTRVVHGVSSAVLQVVPVPVGAPSHAIPAGTGILLADADHGTSSINPVALAESAPHAANLVALETPVALDPYDAHLYRYLPSVSPSEPPVAPVDPDAPDPYDAHLNHYPVPWSLADAQLTDTTAGFSFANSLISLRNWGEQNDLGHLSTLVSTYNTFTQLGANATAFTTTGAPAVNGNSGLGQVGAGLGFITAVQSGNPISIASSGASLYNSAASSLGMTAIPIPVIGALNIVGAMQSGNPFAIASSVAAMFPPWGTIASIVISIIGSMVEPDIPEPPQGAVHFAWNETGAIQIQTDHDVSQGASTAQSAAGSVLGLLQSVVTANNDTNDTKGLGSNNLAIDPSRMPRIGHTAGQNWLEINHPDGSVTKEGINPDTIGERIVQIALANDALVPVWQIQTAQAHAKTAHAQAVQAHADAEAAHAQAVHEVEVFNANAIDGQTRTAPLDPNANNNTAVDMDGHAPVGPAPVQVNLHKNPSVFGVEGKAVESADHRTQTFGALVIHLNSPAAQQHLGALATTSTTPATNSVLADTDGDGFWEQTQWVAGKDKDGNVQGMLVLDRNNNKVIENADILHLGGDSNQLNSMDWLDSNGDGVLNASDPAFAAIKLFVDLDNDGRVDDGEQNSMQSLGLSSINFTTGQVNYSNGQSDTLTATTLTADTEGLKLEKITVVGEDGKLKELEVGSLIVHEGYQGQVRVNNKGQIVADDDPAADNRWVAQRINSYEFNAAHLSDWEGTAEQDQHRHGGVNVLGASTETSVTGISSVGPVLGKENVKTYTTMDVGDKRITSDAPRTRATSDGAPNATLTLNAGDARIRSLAPAEQTTRVVFVPGGVREGWMTADGKELLQLPDDGLFGTGGMSGALMAVALGAVQTTAFAMPDTSDQGFTWQTTPLLLDASNTNNASNTVNFGNDAGTDGSGGNASAFTISAGNYANVRHVHLGVRLGTAPLDPTHVPGLVVHGGASTGPTRTRDLGPWQATVHDLGNPPVVLAPDGSAAPTQTLIYNPTSGKSPTPTAATTGTTTTRPSTAPADPGSNFDATSPSSNTTTTSDTLVTGPSPSNPTSPTLTLPPASPPTNTSATTTNDHLSNPLEDLPLHVSFATLLANDTNASSITLVGNATHGTVAIVGGEVVFTPAANYHGAASFQYQVVSTDGTFALGQADFDISAANDVPVALGEAVTGTEDTSLLISQANLLLNDTDVDVATDNQQLSISAVGNAQHGTVSLVNGQVQFTADADFHGTASFQYLVSDGNGGSATATATVQVASVNDVPVVFGEVITGAEDSTLLINPMALLANDTDADIATDNQILAISAVSNATHGTVSILGSGQIQFIPDANYVGTASFDYVVDDDHGGTVTTAANILVGSLNDAPVASGETVNGLEDQVVTLTAAALLANETDVDDPISALSISRVTAGAGGSVVLSNGNIVFTPNANFSGTASFTYWVKDPSGMESNPATVTLNVLAVNDAPYAQGEVLSGASEDATFNIDKSVLLGNDGDEEDSQGLLGIELVGNASSGTVSVGAGGNVVFTPTANFNGNVTFQYQVRDSSGALSPVVTAQFNVAAVNDTPLGVDEQLTPMYTNTASSPSTTTIGFNTLLGNDSDVDNLHSDLTVSGVRNANNGTVSIVNGAVSFTPTLNFNGTASFEYQVNDQHGGQTWATAFISVAPPPNLYPTVNVTYFNFYPTGTTPAGAWDVGELNWSIVDDGNTGLVSVTYLSGDFHVFGNPGAGVPSLPWNTFTTTQTSWYVNVPRAYAVDGFTTTWRVVDDRGLENTWHFNYTVGSGYQSFMDFTGYAPPVVLALHSDSPHYIETQYSNVRFDLDGDGVADQVAWAAPGSGVLGIDLNGDHQISNAGEFAFAQYVAGAKTDLEGLRAFDSNLNGMLDAGDAQWSLFGVWEDKNSDGATQDGEYNTLDTLGIANINLNSHAPTHAQGKPADGHLTGVAVMAESSFTWADGSTGQVHDAMLAFQPAAETITVAEPAQIEPSHQTAGLAPYSHEAEVMRMALLFNQMCNTANDADHNALGYVPMQAETHWQDAVVALPPQSMHVMLQGG